MSSSVGGEKKITKKEAIFAAKHAELEKSYEGFFKLKRRLLHEIQMWWKVRNEAYQLGFEFFVPFYESQEELNLQLDSLRRQIRTRRLSMRREFRHAKLKDAAKLAKFHQALQGHALRKKVKKEPRM